MTRVGTGSTEVFLIGMVAFLDNLAEVLPLVGREKAIGTRPTDDNLPARERLGHAVAPMRHSKHIGEFRGIAAKLCHCAFVGFLGW